jgi:hypothetical protein
VGALPAVPRYEALRRIAYEGRTKIHSLAIEAIDTRALAADHLAHRGNP